MSLFLVYCPYPGEDEAEKAAEVMLHEKLCACANIFRSTSLYFWQGDLAVEGEFVVLFKTVDSKLQILTQKIRESHPYTIPAIIAIKVEIVNPEYLAWVEKELASSAN
jgi:periplasmic divalent cation tolerance protein